jgi:glycosyltransferase involved in cell wall biosynthesis
VTKSTPDGIRVSVVIPAFNVEDCIGEAIDSILAQRHLPDEVIVVDDGSTDGTASRVRRYGSAVRYLFQDNAGPSAARNNGITAARGEWIAFLDSDDIWLPDKLAAELEVIRRDPGLMWVCSNHFLKFFGQETPYPRFDPALAENYLGVQHVFDSFLQAMTRGLGWDPTAFMVRKATFHEVGLFREGLNYAEDLDLFLRIAHRYPRVGFVPVPLAVHQVDRPDGLCQRQSIPEKMRVLREIYDDHEPAATGNGTIGYLVATFRQIVHDNVRILLLAAQSREVGRLLDLFGDVLGHAYVGKIRVLLMLPPAIRTKIYRKAEWRIRGLAR